MEKRRCIDRLMLLVILTTGILFYSCKDDVFNAEKVKATYQDKFPVKDIDPQMDWKMTRQVTVNVAVYEDAGVDYTIRIYDQNPLTSQSSASLLAEGTANSATTFTTTMDCPNILTEAFVCRIDGHNRSVVKYVSIENNQINTTFGTPSAFTRAFVRDEKGSIKIETYSPQKTEAEIRALLSDAEEVDAGTNFQNGKVYKISKNKVYEQKQFTQGGLEKDNPAIVIIEGQWAPRTSVDVQRGFEFYILNGGEINIPDNNTLSLVESSNFIVYPGGSIKGHQLALTNASGGKYNYSAGTIKVNTMHVSTGGVFYNCGTVDIGNMDFTSGCKFINQGKAHIGNTNTNLIIENGCYLEADCLVCALYMGNNTGAKITNFGNGTNNYNTKISLGNNSMITVTGKAELKEATFEGPMAQHALVKINKIENIGNIKSYNNIYYEVKEIDTDITEDIWWQAPFLEAIQNSNSSISKWGEAPIVIPSGECTGEGNTPGEGAGTQGNPMKYTYVFEDNYPLVGDYDFNDAVLDVSYFYKREKSTNKIKAMQIEVTLAATGAGKILGAGLRLVNIPKSAIDEIDTDGADDFFQRTLKSKNFFNYNEDSHTENGDKDVVIPLFGNAHQVFENAEQGEMINTDPTLKSYKAYTYEIIIEFKDKDKTDPIISKDNLDFFICYQYKTMEKRMEVHLYEFWKYGATAAGTIQQENLDLAGNNTWAICVPNFRYPKEYINISNQGDNSDCAYPEFLNWARDHNTSQDWYLHPNTENVYR